MAILNPNINNIEKGSTTETLYNRLLSGLSQSSQETLPDFTGPDYVSEGGVVNVGKINAEINTHADISRKNAAYMFASSIVSSLGVGGSGGIDGAVSISGDSMTGKLYTLYGFAAGENGIKIFEVSQINGSQEGEVRNLTTINGELHLNDGIWINDSKIINYNNKLLEIASSDIKLNGRVSCSIDITVGDVKIYNGGITYKEHMFYHEGNSNLHTVDWKMKNGSVDGNLDVVGLSNLTGRVTAHGGVSLGYDNTSIIDINSVGTVNLNGDFNIVGGGVQFNGDYIIHIKNNQTVSFSASNKTMNLGDDGTTKITIQTGLYDNDGEYEMISKYGSAYFPQSFKAGHGLGNVLIGTYKVSKEDSGVIFYRYLRFQDTGGPGMKSDGTNIIIESPFKYNVPIAKEVVQMSEQKRTSIGYIESTSLYAPLNRKSSSFSFSTEADFYVFDKPLEGTTSIGITGSKTRLLENQLFFRDGVYMLAIEDGIKHYGNAYITGSIGSVKFSSGFAGSGWKIYKNKLSGNICATFDELTIRKKMRVYELEVQKIRSTNGSLWVSDSCSGDTVEEII